MIGNVVLVIISVLLILNLFSLSIPNVAKAIALLDSGDELAIIDVAGEMRECSSRKGCCLEARKQLDCSFDSQLSDFGRVDWKCSTPGSGASYLFNKKAYAACLDEVIWK